MKILLAAMIVLLSMSATGEEVINLCVHYEKEDSTWETSKILVKSVSECVDLVEKLDGLQLENGYIIQPDDYVNFQCDVGDGNPETTCM